MKNKLAKLFCLLFLVPLSFEARTQYLTGIGFFAGSTPKYGLSFIRYFVPRGRGALDVNIGYKSFGEYRGPSATVLYEIHSKNHSVSIEVANVGFFVGLGGHLGFLKLKGLSGEGSRISPIGLDLAGGIEWKLPHIPFLLSGNAKLFYEYVKQVNTQKLNNQLDGLRGLDIGWELTLRYVFR